MSTDAADFDKINIQTSVPQQGIYSNENYVGLGAEALNPGYFMGDDSPAYFASKGGVDKIHPVKCKLYSNRVSPVLGWQGQHYPHEVPAEPNPDINWIMDFCTYDLYTLEDVFTPGTLAADDEDAEGTWQEQLSRKNRVYENATIKGPVFKSQHSTTLTFNDDGKMLGYPQVTREYNKWGITDVEDFKDLNICRPVPGWPLRLQRIPLCIDVDNPLYDIMSKSEEACADADEWYGGSHYEAGDVVVFRPPDGSEDHCDTLKCFRAVSGNYNCAPLFKKGSDKCWGPWAADSDDECAGMWKEVVPDNCGECKNGQISGYFYTLATDPVFFPDVDLEKMDEDGNPLDEANPEYLNPTTLQWISKDGMLPLNTICNTNCGGGGLYISGDDCYGKPSVVEEVTRIRLGEGLYIGHSGPWDPDICYSKGVVVTYQSKQPGGEPCPKVKGIPERTFGYKARKNNPKGPPASGCGDFRIVHSDWEEICPCPDEECITTINAAPNLTVSGWTGCCESLNLPPYFEEDTEYIKGRVVRYLVDLWDDQWEAIPEEDKGVTAPEFQVYTACFKATESTEQYPIDEVGYVDDSWELIDCPEEEGPILVENIQNITFGRGFKLAAWTNSSLTGCSGELAKGTGCWQNGMVEVEACMPLISGIDCTGGTGINCVPFECLSFTSGDFCVETGSGCEAIVHWAGFSISGTTGYCCEDDPPPPEWMDGGAYNKGDKVYFDETDKCYQSLEDNNFETPADEIGEPNEEWEEVSCSTDNSKNLKHIKNIVLGNGLRIADYYTGSGCCDTGWARIESCNLSISGVDCSGSGIDCQPYECLSFASGDFCIETGGNCDATVYWGGFSISGSTGDCCDILSLPAEYEWDTTYFAGDKVYFDQTDACYEATEDEPSEPPVDEVGDLNEGWTEISCIPEGDSAVARNVKNIVLGRGLKLVDFSSKEGSGDCCSATGWAKIETCTPSISGIDCSGETGINCVPFDCLAFNSGDFCLETGEDCSVKVYWGGFGVSGVTGSGCCETGNNEAVDLKHIKDLRFGKGFTITDYYTGDCCDTGWVEVETCSPSISGIDCSGNQIDCTPFECLAFDTGSFCIETGENCETKVYWGGFGVSGVTGSGCCETGNNEAVDLKHIKDLRFGKGFTITDYYTGDCCDTGWVEVETCSPSISGIDCSGNQIDCTPFECLAFDTGSFCIETGENCETKVYWGGMSVSGFTGDCCDVGGELPPQYDWDLGYHSDAEVSFQGKCYKSLIDENEEMPADEIGEPNPGWEEIACGYDQKQGFKHVKNLDFGRGLIVAEIGEGDCCTTTGALSISVCSPKISGIDCSGEQINCEPFDCLAFDTGNFCIETGEDCSVKVYWGGFGVSGVTGSGCCETGNNEAVDLKHIKDLRFGKGFTITDYYTGDCCDTGWVEVETCSPSISGIDCSGNQIDCTPFDCLAFDTANFCIETGEDCKTKVYWGGFDLVGSTGNCCPDENLYSNDVIYDDGDTVAFEGDCWRCNEDDVQGCPPDLCPEYWDLCHEKELSRIKELRFGKGLRVADYYTGDCCESGWAQIEACIPSVSGIDCSGNQIDCTPFDCLAFDTGSFCIETGSGCEAIIHWAGFDLVGSTGNCCPDENLYSNDVLYNDGDTVAFEGDCWRCNEDDVQGCPPDLCPEYWDLCHEKEISRIKELRFGKGLRVTDYYTGECCDSGWAKIEACVPSISGIDCSGNQIDCVPFECLSFNTGHFCIETGAGCETVINWAGLSVSGASGCCESEDGGLVENVSQLRFGKGISLVASGEGDCCEPSWVQLEGCIPEISGVTCDGEPIGWTGFTQLALGSGLCLEYADCVATISATGGGSCLSGINECDITEDCPVALTITGSFCNGANFVETSCAPGSVEVSLNITAEMLEDCLEICCLEYLDHDEEPQTLAVFVPECVTDCYGCC